jgi:hypothetical protein
MVSAEQSGEPLRDFGSPATWGDVERVRTSLDAKIDTQIAEVMAQMAEMETRLVTRIGESEAGLGARMASLEAGLDTKLAQLEMRLTRMFLGAVAAGVAVLGVLFGIFQAVD